MNKKINKNLNYFLNSLSFILILIIFFVGKNTVNASTSITWVEVSKTNEGIQYLDKDSLLNKGRGIIELTSKYSKFDNNNSSNVDENIYKMKINCLNNEFKDISVNGKKVLNSKWEDPNGDKLLDDIISYSCKNV